MNFNFYKLYNILHIKKLSTFRRMKNGRFI